MKTAKDVFDEQAANARKRKREEDGEGATEMEHDEQAIPETSQDDKQSKRQKRDRVNVIQASSADTTALDKESRGAAKSEKARLKKDRKKAKVEKKAAKAEAKKARKQQETAVVQDSEPVVLEQKPGQQVPHADDEEARSEGSGPDHADIEPIEIDKGFADEDLAATASPSPPADVSVFDASNQDSGSSSISSIVPPTANKSLSLSMPQTSISDPKSEIPNTDSTTTQLDTSPEALKARLAARIEALRTARKASDPSHAPQNRQELIEARRRKEEERKAHKKELRRKAKAEEAARHSETLARGSPLLSNTNSPLLLSPGSPASETNSNNFSFNRISFAHGTNSSSLNNKPIKGPSDPRTALIAAQTKKSRLSALPASKQLHLAEQESWQRATQRAEQQQQDQHAIKKDDTSLLKKTLKRKEKLKKKSEREWNVRLEGVEKSQAARQKKREENLSKRREDKQNHKKGGSKNKGGNNNTKKKGPKARPGFEGSFKAKHASPKTSNSGGGGPSGKEKPRRR